MHPAATANVIKQMFRRRKHLKHSLISIFIAIITPRFYAPKNYAFVRSSTSFPLTKHITVTVVYEFLHVNGGGIGWRWRDSMAGLRRNNLFNFNYYNFFYFHNVVREIK